MVGPAAERDVLGVIGRIGRKTGTRAIEMLERVRRTMARIAGEPTHPMLGLPGGVANAIPEAERAGLAALGRDAVEFARFTLDLFHQAVTANDDLLMLITGDAHYHQTHYMGLVDDDDRVSFIRGQLRVVRPDGRERCRFDARDYARHIGEHVEPWTDVKFPFLREPGWRGFVDGEQSGIFRVAPLARLNAAEGMATPLADAEYQRMFNTFGGGPVHNILANDWARLIELLYAAERVAELAGDEVLTSPEVRNLDLQVPREGVGVVEAPRGTLIHHYTTDDNGVLTACKLLVATVNNAAAISMAIDRAARRLIRGGTIEDGLLNRVEMTFRAFDPCMSCATDARPGAAPLALEVYDAAGELQDVVTGGRR